METSDVRKRIKDSIERARKAAADRRARNSEASTSYEGFLQSAAVPVFQQAASALKAEGYPFTVNTPAGSVRLLSEHSSHDFIDLRLDTTGARPQVLLRVERMKGRETKVVEHALNPGALIGSLTEQHVLDAIAEGIVDLIER